MQEVKHKCRIWGQSPLHLQSDRVGNKDVAAELVEAARCGKAGGMKRIEPDLSGEETLDVPVVHDTCIATLFAQQKCVIDDVSGVSWIGIPVPFENARPSAPSSPPWSD